MIIAEHGRVLLLCVFLVVHVVFVVCKALHVQLLYDAWVHWLR